MQNNFWVRGDGIVY